jgi:hypothetical protein
MPSSPYGDIVELSKDSVVLIDELAASGKLDAETLDRLERNARHLEIIMSKNNLNAETKSLFESAIAKARALID